MEVMLKNLFASKVAKQTLFLFVAQIFGMVVGFVSNMLLAKQMGAKTSNVCLWAKGKKKVPTNRCPDIERITEGKVTCEELRPDVNWGVLRNSKGQ